MIFLLPVLTGLLLCFSFPRFDQGYLAWVAFIPLAGFLLRSGSVRQGFLGGYIAGFIQLFALLNWMPAVLAHYGGLPKLLAWIAYSLLILVLACFPAAACGTAKYLIRKGGDGFLLAFPAVWIVVEYVQNFFPFGGLPWLTAGYSQSRFLTLIQISDVAGVYGVSFLLAWTGVAAVWLIVGRQRRVLRWMPAAFALVLLSGSLAYGRFSLKRWEMPNPKFQAALLQGNISFDDPAHVLLDKFKNGYVRMAERLGRSGTDLLVLPESPSPVYFESDSEYRQNLERLASRFSFGIIFNNIRHVPVGDDFRYFNSAYFVDNQGILTGVYDKMHLVPFGEYVPLQKAFFFIDMISKDVGSFSSGAEYRVVKLRQHSVNAVICFEAVFPALVRQFVRNGSELIVNLTNDGWYGDTAAPYQHLAIARFRAVENRRFLLRSTNSGISAVIAPSGRIEASTGILREAICIGRFDFIAFRSIYTRYGDVFVFLCAIISCASAVLAALRRGSKRPD